MVAMIKQLSTSLKNLKLQALGEIYSWFDEKHKNELDVIKGWRMENKKPEEVLGSKKDKNITNRRILRNVSIAYNRAGFSVYKDFLSIDIIVEQFAGVIVEAFLAMKPYLQYIREEREHPKRENWGMRRFHFMIVIPCQKFLDKNFKNDMEKILENFGDREDKNNYRNKKYVVPLEWLGTRTHERYWLIRKGYIEARSTS